MDIASTRRARPAAAAAGFTLIETLVSLTVFAFVLTGLTRMLTSVIQSNDEARRLTRAGALAQAQLESLQSQPYAGIASGSDRPGGPYSRRWTATADAPVAGAKTVVVTVEWSDKQGTHAVSLPSVISPSGDT